MRQYSIGLADAAVGVLAIPHSDVIDSRLQQRRWAAVTSGDAEGGYALRVGVALQELLPCGEREVEHRVPEAHGAAPASRAHVPRRG